jgi:hypothetical protein
MSGKLTQFEPKLDMGGKYDVPNVREYIDGVATAGSFHVGAKNEYSASSEFIVENKYND